MMKWADLASSVPGLVVSALSVSDWMTFLCLVGAWQDMDCFIRKRHVGGVQLPLAGARRMLMMCVDVDVGVDVDDVATSTSSNAGLA